MPPDAGRADDPREWLIRAQSNLIRASTPIEGVVLEDLCFDAQQAAEKALKALLASRSIRFPFVHDLNLLVTLLADSGLSVPEFVLPAGRLTRYAVVTRYPGVIEPVTAEEHEELVDLATVIVNWVEGLLSP